MLKWKQICGTDVFKCYQQSTSLASIIVPEVEHQVLPEFFRSVHKTQEERFKFNGVKISAEFLLGKGYTQWTTTRRRQTTLCAVSQKVYEISLVESATVDAARSLVAVFENIQSLIAGPKAAKMIWIWDLESPSRYSLLLMQMEGKNFLQFFPSSKPFGFCLVYCCCCCSSCYSREKTNCLIAFRTGLILKLG